MTVDTLRIQGRGKDGQWIDTLVSTKDCPIGGLKWPDVGIEKYCLDWALFTSDGKLIDCGPEFKVGFE
jgi:hypothetical protein